MSDEIFSFQGRNYHYFDHPHNQTRINERTVEIPIGLDFIDLVGASDLVEVGCVTPYYQKCDHEVIDLTDDHPLSRKIDATEFSFIGKNVLSISTVEHVGFGDYGNQKKENNAAIFLCERIMRESKRYFVTWPLGFNKILDEWAFQRKDGLFLSRQDGNKYLWQQKTLSELSDDNKVYGSFHCANSIIILTNT